MMREQKGQTLLEILLAFSVSILVLSAVILGIVTSLSNTQYTKNQGLASSYAQEGMAIVRQMRDSSWNNFSSLKDYTTNTRYCLGQNPMELKELTLPNQNCWVQSPIPAGGIFSREVKFEHNSLSCCSNNSLNCSTGIKGSKTTVTVSWSDNKCSVGDNLCHKVELITCFSNTSLLGFDVSTLTPVSPTPTPVPVTDSLILRPNADGDYINIDHWPTPPHWSMVDEAVADGATTRVFTYSKTQLKDAYQLDNPSFGPDVVINSVTVWFVFTASGVEVPSYAQPFLRLGGAETAGTEVSYSDPYTWSTVHQTLSRPGGGAWSPSDIDSLQVCIGLRAPPWPAGDYETYLTQAYVEVSYTH